MTPMHVGSVFHGLAEIDNYLIASTAKSLDLSQGRKLALSSFKMAALPESHLDSQAGTAE